MRKIVRIQEENLRRINRMPKKYIPIGVNSLQGKINYILNLGINAILSMKADGTFPEKSNVKTSLSDTIISQKEGQVK